MEFLLNHIFIPTGNNGLHIKWSTHHQHEHIFSTVVTGAWKLGCEVSPWQRRAWQLCMTTVYQPVLEQNKGGNFCCLPIKCLIKAILTLWIKIIGGFVFCKALCKPKRFQVHRANIPTVTLSLESNGWSCPALSYILFYVSRMEPRNSAGYCWLSPISNLLIPSGCWGVHMLWGKAAVPEQPRCDAPTHQALSKSSLTGGVALKQGLPWLSQQALPNNVAGAYTVVRSQLAAIWEQMPSGCQIVILSFSILPVFLWIGFWPFFPQGRIVPQPNHLRFISCKRSERMSHYYFWWNNL